MSYGELCVLLRLPVYSLRCAGGGLTDPLAWPQLAQSLGRTSITLRRLRGGGRVEEVG